MRTMWEPRGSGKTYQAIREAAAAQDEGAECVIFIVPTEEEFDWVLPTMVEFLDMSRVDLCTAQQALEGPKHYRKSITSRKWFKTIVTKEPEYVVIDNADRIPLRLYHKLLDHYSNTVRMLTGESVPGMWQNDLTQWGNPGKVSS